MPSLFALPPVQLHTAIQNTEGHGQAHPPHSGAQHTRESCVRIRQRVDGAQFKVARAGRSRVAEPDGCLAHVGAPADVSAAGPDAVCDARVGGGDREEEGGEGREGREDAGEEGGFGGSEGWGRGGREGSVCGRGVGGVYRDVGVEAGAAAVQVDARSEGGAELMFRGDVVDCLARVHKSVGSLKGRERASHDFVLHSLDKKL